MVGVNCVFAQTLWAKGFTVLYVLCILAIECGRMLSMDIKQQYLQAILHNTVFYGGG
jgi:hypothetical protein